MATLGVASDFFMTVSPLVNSINHYDSEALVAFAVNMTFMLPDHKRH